MLNGRLTSLFCCSMGDNIKQETIVGRFEVADVAELSGIDCFQPQTDCAVEVSVDSEDVNDSEAGSDKELDYDSEYDSEYENFFLSKKNSKETIAESKAGSEKKDKVCHAQYVGKRNCSLRTKLFTSFWKMVGNIETLLVQNAALILSLVFVAIIGVIFHFFVSDANIYGASLSFWSYMTVLFIVSYYASVLVTLFVCIFVIENIYILKKKFFHYVSILRFPVTLTLWMAICFTWCCLVYPFDKDDNKEASASSENNFHNTVSFLKTLFRIGLFHGVLLSTKAVVVKHLSTNFYKAAYLQKLEDTILAEHALYLLAKKPKNSKNKRYILHKAPSFYFETEEERQNMILNDVSIHSTESFDYVKSFNLMKKNSSFNGEERDEDECSGEYPESVSDTKLLRMTRFVKTHRISSLIKFKGVNEIDGTPGLSKDEKTKKKVKLFAKYLFQNIRSNSSDPTKNNLVEEDFRNFMKNSIASKVFDLFFRQSFQAHAPVNEREIADFKNYKTDYNYSDHMKFASKENPRESDKETRKEQIVPGLEHRYLSMHGLQTAVESIYNDRKFLSSTLGDGEAIMEKLSLICTFLVSIVTMIYALVQLGYSLEKLIFTFSTLFVGYAFAFGSTIRTLFECSIFLFVTRPYVIGDKIYIETPELILEVKKINLFTTEFFNWDGKKYIYPNQVLANRSFVNANQSRPCFEVITIEVSSSLNRYLEQKKLFRNFINSQTYLEIRWLSTLILRN